MKYTSRGLRRRGEADQWEATLSHRDPLSGETVRSYHTITARTEKQARRKRDELILELERKGAALSSKMTVRDYLTEFVAYKRGSGTVEPSTIRGYEKEARQISKYIGDIRLTDLAIPDVNAWMAQMIDEGYAAETVTKDFRLLNQALKYAQAQDLLAKNPCTLCKAPKRSRRKTNTLDRAERSRMLELARRAQPEPLGMAIELALTTGMRRGEVCALRWSDVTDRRTIVVSRALGLGEGGWYEKDPKSETSAREIPLTRTTWAMLSAMKRDVDRLYKMFGLAPSDPFVLGTREPDSKPYNPTALTKEFAAVCKMNGFKCTFHDLRHTFATFMIAEGVDVRTVSSYLGHANVALTLNTYADVDPQAKLAAVDKIEAAFDVEMGAPAPAEPATVSETTLEGLSVGQLEALLEAARRREETR